jgi:hypothetical protein
MKFSTHLLIACVVCAALSLTPALGQANEHVTSKSSGVAQKIPVESAEHKFLVAKEAANYARTLNAYEGAADCAEMVNNPSGFRLQKIKPLPDGEEFFSKTQDGCDSHFKPIENALLNETVLITAQLESVDACTKVFRRTIDKKTSDLTVRESKSVKICQDLDLYPLDMSVPK